MKKEIHGVIRSRYLSKRFITSRARRGLGDGECCFIPLFLFFIRAGI